ncbi:ATP-binding cassette domain-containing protein [Mesorhizobium sp. M0830]|uniref:ATP-binding cassette domain-containing protein n=1 Tax=Mesorhizobium sp. M0830 TaxID=2957008 RepID=UPI0033397F02
MVFEPALALRGVRKSYSSHLGLLGKRELFSAVDGVSFNVERGSVFGLIGESGCGKSTLARLMVGLEQVSSGEILVSGTDVAALSRLERARKIQIIFQDPNGSLNPRKSIGSILTLPLRVHRLGSPREQNRRAVEMLDLVGLPKRVLDSLPGELSGGQRQRVAIGRALIMRPEIVVCDEPTSALDVSVQAQILNLLDDLRVEFGLTYVLISHNLAVVEHMASRIGVMCMGRIIEHGSAPDIMQRPQHAYTKLLLSAVLTPDPSLGLPFIDDRTRADAISGPDNRWRSS